MFFLRLGGEIVANYFNLLEFTQKFHQKTPLPTWERVGERVGIIGKFRSHSLSPSPLPPPIKGGGILMGMLQKVLGKLQFQFIDNITSHSYIMVMYAVEYLEGAVKDLRRVDPQWRKRILIEIEKLSQNPFMKSRVKKLVNSPYYRLRVGDYRVVYDLKRDRLVILVIHIRKREEAYG